MWLLHGVAAIGRDSGALECSHFVGGARHSNREADPGLSTVMFMFLRQVCFAYDEQFFFWHSTAKERYSRRTNSTARGLSRTPAF